MGTVFSISHDRQTWTRGESISNLWIANKSAEEYWWLTASSRWEPFQIQAAQHYLITQQAGKLVAQGFDCDSAKTFGVEHILLDHAGQVSASETGALALRTEAQVRSTLVWRDREGRRLGTLDKPDDYWQAAISPDGRFVAIVRHDSLTGIFRAWIAALPNGQTEVFSDSNHVDSLAWAQDGGMLYYVDFIQRKLFRRRVDPHGPEEFVQSVAIGDSIRGISPDGLTMIVERSKGWRPLGY